MPNRTEIIERLRGAADREAGVHFEDGTRGRIADVAADLLEAGESREEWRVASTERTTYSTSDLSWCRATAATWRDRGYSNIRIQQREVTRTPWVDVEDGVMAELHGIEKMPFPDWEEEGTYLEAVTVKSRDQAVAFLSEEMCVEPDDLNVRPIHMRWVENAGQEAWIGPDGCEHREGWLECKADHPDAVPFWKDDPYA